MRPTSGSVIWLVALVLVSSVRSGPSGPAHPLELVRRLVSARAAACAHPVVVFDIDDTLVRVTPRTKHILACWADLWPPQDGTATCVATLDPDRMPYALEGALDQAGVQGRQRRLSASRFWSRWFFSAAFLADDRMVSGAVVFVREMVHRGATVVYLTGRDEPRMGRGTRDALRRLGFPLGEHTVLLMKPEAGIADLAWKRAACARISRLGTVSALFDNEPGNVNAFARTFPGAAVVLIDTAHSPGAPPLAPGIPRLPNFSSTTGTRSGP